MKLVQVTRLDSIKLDESFFTSEGFLIDTPKVTCTGIFEYTNPDGSIRRELRLPEHVFNEKSLATYEGKPVIITHDAGRVTKENVTGEIVGTMLSKGYQDGEHVRVKIIIHDIDTVKNSNMRELSLGYDLVLDETPGELNGQPYDAIQTEIVINHLAIVKEARAGEQARLNIDNKQTDSEKGENIMESENKDIEMSEEETKETEVKENSDIEEQSIEKILELIKDRRDRRDKNHDNIEDLNTDIDTLLEVIDRLQASHDMAIAENDTKDNDENKDEEEHEDEEQIKQSINADSIDKLISERLKLGRLGDRLHLDGLETLKPIEAKKRIIKAIKPDLKLDGKGKAYINTAFDIAVQELNKRKDTKYQRGQMFNEFNSDNKTNMSKAQKARKSMLERMQKSVN